ncbi:hypothetical protein [Dactylosporangium sp. NPDC051541]|uniref:hypothetical protein n=1 Tax=Dactylosporangium sp. NPDC051541 TaxID=3363977 RepID=UPI00378C84DA
MTVDGERVLWSHRADGPAARRAWALPAGAVLLAVALIGMAVGVHSAGLAAVVAFALLAGPALLLWHFLRTRRRTITRVWTDPARPGVVLLRTGGTVRALNPARVRRIRLVHTSGAYRDERPGERIEWHGYSLTRLTLRAGLTWYSTPDQARSGTAGTRELLAATFRNARISEHDRHVSSQESAD